MARHQLLVLAALTAAACEPEPPRVRKNIHKPYSTDAETATDTGTATESESIDRIASRLHIALLAFKVEHLADTSSVAYARRVPCLTGDASVRAFNEFAVSAFGGIEAERAEFLDVTFSRCGLDAGEDGTYQLDGRVAIRRQIDGQGVNHWAHFPEGLTINEKRPDESQADIAAACDGRLEVRTGGAGPRGEFCGQTVGDGPVAALRDLSAGAVGGLIDAWVPAAAGAADSPLTGLWDAANPCFLGSKESWKFGAEGVTRTVTTYSDPMTCSTPRLTTTTAYNFTVRAAADGAQGPSTVDLLEVSATYEPHDAVAATALSSARRCGRADWQPGATGDCASARGTVSYRTFRAGDDPSSILISDDSDDPTARKNPDDVFVSRTP